MVGGIVLHYRWSEIQASENYEHNLLRRVVRDLQGTAPGADALVELLRSGPCFPDYEEFLETSTPESPLHYRIILLLTSATWRKLNDSRLLKIEAEAYETWWSLSVAAMDDPELEQNGLRAADFSAGAEAALMRRLSSTRPYCPAAAIQNCAAVWPNFGSERIHARNGPYFQ
jgi:hypothetical protein